MKGHNIGKALSLVSNFSRGCAEGDEFGRAMGAPMGELQHFIDRGEACAMRRIRRQVKALTGLKWREFEREVERRTSARWVHFASPLGDPAVQPKGPIMPSWRKRGW